MGRHHVPGDESPFLKRIFIPFYFIRILLYLVHMATYGILLGGLIYIEEGKDETKLKTQLGNTAIGVAIACVAVSFVFAVACLSVDISCIVKRHRRTLTPRYFLIANVLQTFFWGGTSILSLVVVHSIGSIILDVIILISFFGVLIHASIVYHRSRKGGIYARAHNPSASIGNKLSDQESMVGADGYEPYRGVGQSYSQPEGLHTSSLPPSYPVYQPQQQQQQPPIGGFYDEKSMGAVPAPLAVPVSSSAASHGGSAELETHHVMPPHSEV